jgi:hypothetical protein
MVSGGCPTDAAHISRRFWRCAPATVQAHVRACASGARREHMLILRKRLRQARNAELDAAAAADVLGVG